MYHRWKSTHVFEWTPILTYTRRHLSLLEWFEENLDPVAFVEKLDMVGIALLSEDLRITVRRSGMTLESGLAGAPISHLLPAVDGVFDVLEPQGTRLSRSFSMATVSLAEVDYHEACAQFGSKMSASSPIGQIFRPTDGSALVDLESDEVRAQVEWGVVEADELLFRLTTPHVGRIDKPGHNSRDEVRFRGPRLTADDVPRVSVLTDVVISRKLGGDVSDTESVGDAIASADELARDVSESLASGFATGMGVDK